MQPDPDTMERLKHLAYVGNALVEISNEVGGNTDIFLAKQALLNFKVGIDKLELPGEIMTGMQNLIKYLEKKIEKRMVSATTGVSVG